MTVKLVGSSSGSVSLQAPASTSGGANRVLTLPDINSTIDTTGRAGNILQVVQTFKKDSFSTTSSSHAEITGLNASITKTSASSKLLITVDIGFGRSGRAVTTFLLYEDSSELTALNGTGTSPRFITNYNHLQGTTEETYSMYNISKTVLIDGQNDTNSHTYKVYGTSNAATLFVNRRSYLYDYGTVSSVTIMEIAA